MVRSSWAPLFFVDWSAFIGGLIDWRVAPSGRRIVGMAPQSRPRDRGSRRRPGKWDRVFHVSRREGEEEGFRFYRRWCALSMRTTGLALLSSRGRARGFGLKRQVSRRRMSILSWWYFATRFLIVKLDCTLEKIISHERIINMVDCISFFDCISGGLFTRICSSSSWIGLLALAASRWLAWVG